MCLPLILILFSGVEPSPINIQSQVVFESTARRWELPIPYVISNEFAANEKELILKSIKFIAENTCVDFMEDHGPGQKLEYNNTGIKCNSHIGDSRWLMGGNQKIFLGKGCIKMKTIQHETMHALGFTHTHSRGDRDDYVNVNFDLLGIRQYHNFVKMEPYFYSFDVGMPFEYGSIMIYPAHLQRLAEPVIVPHDQQYSSSMAASPSMTFLDRKMINVRYKCSARCPRKILCYNEGYQHPRNCSRCICSDFHSGRFCENEVDLVQLRQNEPITVFFNSTGDSSYHREHIGWADFNMVKRVIKAPKDHRIRVTISLWMTRQGLSTRLCHKSCTNFGVEIADGDLTYTGKKICCIKKDQQLSFVSNSNIIGYRAYARRDISFTVALKLSIEHKHSLNPTISFFF